MGRLDRPICGSYSQRGRTSIVFSSLFLIEERVFSDGQGGVTPRFEVPDRRTDGS